MAILVKIFNMVLNLHLWLSCLLKERKPGIFFLAKIFLPPSQQSFFLIFYGRPPQSSRGQMDDCCSLWSCWQRDQQSHNAPWRDAERCMPGTLCRLTPTDTLFSGRLVEKHTRTRAAGRRRKDTIDRARTLIKTLKINVHLSPYPSGDVCGSQPLVRTLHKSHIEVLRKRFVHCLPPRQKRWSLSGAVRASSPEDSLKESSSRGTWAVGSGPESSYLGRRGGRTQNYVMFYSWNTKNHLILTNLQFFWCWLGVKVVLSSSEGCTTCTIYSIFRLSFLFE